MSARAIDCYNRLVLKRAICMKGGRAFLIMKKIVVVVLAIAAVSAVVALIARAKAA